MVDNLQMSIPNFEKRIIESKEVTFYNIEMRKGDKRWMISKRYSEMVELNNYINENFMPISSFPSKEWFFRNDEERLQHRRTALDLYLHVRLLDTFETPRAFQEQVHLVLFPHYRQFDDRRKLLH